MLNRHPLLFPDTGIYIAVASGGLWPVDRSGFYALFASPIIRVFPTTVGLWIWVVAQSAINAAILLAVAERLTKTVSPGVVAFLLATVFLTTLPWHVGQLMPDAFSGATVLLAWLAPSRDPDEDGAPILLLGVLLVVLMHLTHVVLLVATSAAVLTTGLFIGWGWRSVAKRALAAGLIVVAAVGAQIVVNGIAFDRWKVTPVGSLFVFAALQEDGVISLWATAHCGHGGPRQLCDLAPTLGRDSQRLLHDPRVTGPVMARQWALIDEIDAATFSAVTEFPLASAKAIIRSGIEQFFSFRAMDDLCPISCAQGNSPLRSYVARDTPLLEPAMATSRQFEGSLPKDAVAALTTPISWLGLTALLPLFLIAVRRRDETAMTLIAAVVAALIANALVTGGLSDVRHRYQSRIIYLAPLISGLILLRRKPASAYTGAVVLK